MEDSPYNAKPSRIPPEERTSCVLEGEAMTLRVLGHLMRQANLKYLCLLPDDVKRSVPATVKRNHAGNVEARVES